MDEHINQAIAPKNVENNTSQPPKKKRKIETQQPKQVVVIEEEDDEIDEKKKSSSFFSFLSTQTPANLRRDFKKILLKNPDINLQQQTAIDDYIDSLSDEDIEMLIENAKFQISLKNPNNNGISFLGFAGDVVERYWGTKGLAQKLIADKELVEMVEDLIPCDFAWLSAPFRILNRILYHIQREPQAQS